MFDEATAREGIQKPLDFLFREQEIRPDFYMAVAKECKAKDIIGFVSPTEVLPGMDMYKSLRTSEKVWSPTSAVNVKEIMSKLMLEGIHPVLTGITLHGDIEQGKTTENVKKPVPLANYVYEGIGVFKKDKLLGWLNEKESRGYSYISHNIKSSIARVKCPDGGDGWFNVELIRAKTKFKPSIKNERPYIEVIVQAQGNIGEVQCAIDMMDPEMYRKMQETTNRKLNEVLEGSVKKVQEYGVDVFGFGEAFHRKYPKHWREWKDNWDEIFKNDLVVDIQVEYQILLHGKINNPFSVEQKK
ncbi:Spore germination protein B3 precursor [compost metagenome]